MITATHWPPQRAVVFLDVADAVAAAADVGVDSAAVVIGYGSRVERVCLLICSPELRYSGAWARYKASFLSSLSPLEVLGITHLRKKCEIANACSQKESQE